MSMHYRRRSKKDPEGQDKSQSLMYRAFNIVIAAGVRMHQIKQHGDAHRMRGVDQRFQIGPYGTFVCVLIAIVAGFRTLYREVLRLEEEDTQRTEKK